MEKENGIHKNMYLDNEHKNNIEDNLKNKKDNNLPTTITEIIESREQNSLPISSIMPNIKEFYISFPNVDNESQDNYNYNENNNELKDENKKIKIRKQDIFKIFKMNQIPKDEIDPYILFSFTSIKSEVVSNIIKKYKVDFNKLMNLINNCYLNFGNEDNNLEVNKNSIMKIFDLLGLSPNSRLNYLQFYEVDEEVEYEEEEDENESENKSENEEETANKPKKIKKIKKIKKDRSDKNNKNNINPDLVFDIQKKTKTTTKSYPEEHNEKKNSRKLRKNDKIKKENDNNFDNINKKEKKLKPKNKISKKNIDKNGDNNIKPKNMKKSLNNKYIVGKDDIVEKLENNSSNNIPSIFHKIKNNKNVKTNKNVKPNNIIENSREPKKRNNYYNNEKEKYNYMNDYSDNNSYEKGNSLGNTFSNQNIDNKMSQSSPDDNNISRYTFITQKKPENDNCIMYLTGSIPLLGNWNQNIAIPMDEEVRNDHIFYTKYLDIKKEDFPFEYKFFYIKNDKITWVGRPKINHISHPEYFNLEKIMEEKINTLSIFDLNIRYLNNIDGLNIWDYRKQKLLKVILKYIPDIIFFQEITRTQYQYLEENFSSVYENVGIYRDNSDHSEKCSISYNKLKYTLTDWGQFWLSSTPYTPGSNDFGNFFPRICTWALLRQINGELLLFFNIHLDHANFKAHVPCIKVVLKESEKILSHCPNIKMVFLGGCFYCEEDDAPINKLKESGYNEIMFENTFHDFTGEADRHWDYMFWRAINHNNNSDIDIVFKRAFVLKEDSIINLKNQQYISDHYPVIAEFEIESINNNINNDLIIEVNKKDFSEMDEEDYLKSSVEIPKDKEKEKEHNIYKDNNKIQIKENRKEEISTKNNEINDKNNNNDDDDENEEEEEVVEVEEEVDDNNENNDKGKKNEDDNDDDINNESKNKEDYNDDNNNENKTEKESELEIAVNEQNEEEPEKEEEIEIEEEEEEEEQEGEEVEEEEDKDS